MRRKSYVLAHEEGQPSKEIKDTDLAPRPHWGVSVKACSLDLSCANCWSAKPQHPQAGVAYEPTYVCRQDMPRLQ